MKLRYFRGILWLMIVFLALVTPSMPQEKPAGSTVSVPDAKAEEEAKEKDAKEKAKQAENKKSLVDNMFSDLKNNATFSIGLYETYDSNILNRDVVRVGTTLTSIYPRFFANIRRQDLDFNFAYSAGYSAYRRFSVYNRLEQAAGLGVVYHASPRLTIDLSDNVSYLPQGSFTEATLPLLPGQAPQSPQNVILAGRNQVFQNTFQGGVSYATSNRSTLRLYGAYHTRRYQNLAINNYDGTTTGVAFDQQLTKKLTFTNQYEFSYFQFNNSFRSLGSHTFEVGVNYELRPKVKIFVSGGPQVSTVLGDTRAGGRFRTGISRDSDKTSVGFSYDRSASSIPSNLGLAAVLNRNAVSGTFSYRLNRVMNVSLSGGYFRGSYFGNSTARLNGYSASSRLEYALRKDLTLTLTYGYLRQRATIFIVGPPNSMRNVIVFGLEYRLPLLKK